MLFKVFSFIYSSEFNCNEFQRWGPLDENAFRLILGGTYRETAREWEMLFWMILSDNMVEQFLGYTYELIVKSWIESFVLYCTHYILHCNSLIKWCQLFVLVVWVAWYQDMASFWQLSSVCYNRLIWQDYLLCEEQVLSSLIPRFLTTGEYLINMPCKVG